MLISRNTVIVGCTSHMYTVGDSAAVKWSTAVTSTSTQIAAIHSHEGIITSAQTSSIVSDWRVTNVGYCAATVATVGPVLAYVATHHPVSGDIAGDVAWKYASAYELIQ